MAQDCEANCDYNSTRTMDQSMARYNDRSGFANNAAQDAFNHLNTMVVVEGLNTLQMHGMANALLQLGKVSAGEPQN